MLRRTLVSLLMLAGCAEEKVGPFQAPPPPGEVVKSQKARVTSPPAEAVFQDVMRGNTAGALALHRELVEGDDSLFFSPLSIQAVLAMTAGGAAGQTADELARFLPMTDAADFHRSMNHLDQQLSARGASSTGAAGEPFAFVRLNHLFVDEQQQLAPAYLDLLAEEYGAGVQRLPIRSDPSGATQTINDWVSQATRSRIPALFAPGQLSESSRLALVNASYFSAEWAAAFTADDVQPFESLGGGVADVTLMRNGNLSAKALETDDVEVVSLGYSGDELSLRVVMPKRDYRAFEASLTAASLSALFSAIQHEALDLSMPPFELRTRRDLKDAMKRLGVELPFEPFLADFSGITGERDLLYLDSLVHEAWVEVSKSGTRAAAATGAGISAAPSAPPQPRRVIIDKPFLFFIVDDATGAVLFMGRYTKG